MFYDFSQLSLLSAFLSFFSWTASQYVTTNGVQFELAGKPFAFAVAIFGIVGAPMSLK